MQTILIHFIVRLFTLLSALLLYCLFFYFILHLSTLLSPFLLYCPLFALLSAFYFIVRLLLIDRISHFWHYMQRDFDGFSVSYTIATVNCKSIRIPCILILRTNRATPKTRNVLNLGSGTPHGFKTISKQLSLFPLLPKYSSLQLVWFSQIGDRARDN
jgi:hypothetical protein